MKLVHYGTKSYSYALVNVIFKTHKCLRTQEVHRAALFLLGRMIGCLELILTKSALLNDELLYPTYKYIYFQRNFRNLLRHNM